MVNRRTWMLGAGGAVFGLGSGLGVEKKEGAEIAVFTKVFQGLSYGGMAEAVAEIGADGVELPVRPKGHVLPERVEEDLPKVVEALRRNGLNLTVMASGINEVSEAQHTEKVLRTAKALGVRRFRMAYYRYDLKKPVKGQLDAIRVKFRELVALCEELGMQAVYQNHSGSNYFGAGLWDLASMLEGTGAESVGCAWDMCHAVTEGGLSWRVPLNLLGGRVPMVFVKDFRWEGRKRVVCPLGEGQVDLKAVFGELGRMRFAGPYSLHVEYVKADDPEARAKGVAAYQRDLGVLRRFLGEVARRA